MLFVWDFRSHALARAWPAAGELRWVHAGSAGVNHVLSPEVVAGGVVVTNPRGVFAEPMAEFAVDPALTSEAHPTQNRDSQADRPGPVSPGLRSGATRDGGAEKAPGARERSECIKHSPPGSDQTSIGRPSRLNTSAPSAAANADEASRRRRSAAAASADRSERCSSIWPGVARIVVSIGSASDRHAE